MQPRHPKHRENPAVACSPLGSERSILSARAGTLIGPETGIQTIAALHSQCRSWDHFQTSNCVRTRSVHPFNNGHVATASACPFRADFVAKVENRTALKISR